MSTEQMVKKGYSDYLADCEKKGNKAMTFDEYLMVIISGLKVSSRSAV